MLAASSPISYPQTSSPPLKRRYPSPSHTSNDAPPRPKPRTRGGFLIDDDSDEDEDEDGAAAPAPKRILIEYIAPEPSQTETDDLPSTTRIENNIDPDEELRYQALFDRPLRVDVEKIDLPPATGSTTETAKLQTCSGRSIPIRQRTPTKVATYESMVASRSIHKEGKAKRSYYGIEIHALIDAAAEEAKAKAQKSAHAAPDQPMPSVEARPAEETAGKRPKRTLLWTEKYRARKFMDLVGDDLTNRQVLRWLKRWDPLVFPHAAKSKAAAKASLRRGHQQQQQEEEKPHRKILMLTGPPGLGKTTLAHVCAKQAGYEVLEINASDDRSRDVVRGRIRTSLGTESVKTVEQAKTADGKPPKVARPVCVVVDEVDGVVSGSGGGGEGGFVKALIDLVTTDQKNSAAGASGSGSGSRRKKKGDDFRQMRPLILICNDVYHISLRPLRQSGLAEIIHVGKPTIDAVVTRLKNVFEKEGVPCEKDAARKLCESAWGMTSGIDARKGAESTVEGDLRGVMVVGEWVAGRVRASAALTGDAPRLTRQWIERNVAAELAHGGGGARGVGRGSAKDVVARVFQLGAGFPKPQGPAADVASKQLLSEQPKAQLKFGEHDKRHAMERLSEMVAASGEVDRIMTEIFAEWPGREFGDDCYMTKPNTAYEWMYFHDSCNSRLFTSQDWELAPYLSQPVLAMHHLFASPKRHVPSAGYDRAWGGADADEKAPPPVPFSGPRADYEAREAEKHNRAALQGIQAQLPPALSRAFRSPEHVATDFLPYLVRLVSPSVKPVVVGGSGGGDRGAASVASVRRDAEKAMVRRAAEVLAEVGVELVKGKIEEANPSAFSRPQWVYRMEPDLDALSTFETMGAHVLATQAPTRYAVRQVLDQELRKTHTMRENAARQARFHAGSGDDGTGDKGFVFDDMGNPSRAGKDEATAPVAAAPSVKKDFFGRIVQETARQSREGNGNGRRTGVDGGRKGEKMIWVTFNEGLNNAVRKPISLEEFLRGL